MRASVLQRAIYRQWIGPSGFALFRPYAMSDVVPDGFFWIVLALSAWETFPDTAACWSFMVVPSFRTTPFNPQAILNPDFLALNNAPPVTSSYQISKGATQPSPEVIFKAGNSNSVNLLKRWLYIRPGSILLALQITDGGGRPRLAVLTAMIIELPYCGETAGIKDLSKHPRWAEEVGAPLAGSVISF